MVLELRGGDSVHLPNFDFGDTEEVHVDKATDLPEPNGSGERVLEDGKAYIFHEIVAAPQTLVYGSSTGLFGVHGSQSGFIHTGGSAALRATGQNTFAMDMLFGAPAGTIFDIDNAVTDEFQFERCSFADPIGMGNIASLGTIDGSRVPAFKGCNFENFDGGITFDGDIDKIFFEGCPFRTVDSAGVTCITLAGTSDIDIVDMSNNYVKGVQSDTEVVRAESGGSPNVVFQYRGTTHDTSVTESNILVGEAGSGVVGYRVTDSYPIRNSSVIGEVSLDTPTTITISASDTYNAIGGTTTLGNESERVSESSAGVLQYDGKVDTNVQIMASLSIEGTNGDTVVGSIFKNGSEEPNSRSEITVSGGGAPQTMAISGVEDLSTGETIEVQLKNQNAANDITVNQYNISFLG